MGPGPYQLGKTSNEMKYTKDGVPGKIITNKWMVGNYGLGVWICLHS